MVHRCRHGRDISGVLLLDKPSGISSNHVLQQVKRIFSATKAGHTGALDPLATGMLPVCLGEATKFSQFLLESDKRYHVIACLGQRTDTADSQGKVTSEREIAFTEIQLNTALETFRGDILQIPSMYSALKHQGQPLYKYARQGIEVKRSARHISVYQLKLIRWADRILELEIHCSKGTYIRTIIDDLGELLGCGAHVTALRRLQVAAYPGESMVTLDRLQALQEIEQSEGLTVHQMLDALLLPVDSAIQHFPEINLLPAMANCIKHGQPLQLSGVPLTGMVRLTEGETRHFIGMGVTDGCGRVVPRRLIA